MSKHIKNENYIVIQGFMINELKLSGNELMLYALIYGFSQAECQRFTGSSNYICEWLSCTKVTARNLLKQLVAKYLIFKYTKAINGVYFNEYEINRTIFDTEIKEDFNRFNDNDPSGEKNYEGGVKNHPPHKKITQGNKKYPFLKNGEEAIENKGFEEGKVENYGGGLKINPPIKKLTGGRLKINPNNIENNIGKNIKREKEEKKEPPIAVTELSVSEYQTLIATFGEYLVAAKCDKARKYTGCYNFETIKEWCKQEADTSRATVKRTNFNKFNGRTYTAQSIYDLERQLLEI